MPNSSDLLAPLTAAGLSVRVENGDRLAVVPADRLTDTLRQHIREHKAELLALLVAADKQDFIEAFEERAAIMEHDGGFPVAEAERQALRNVALEFHFRDGGGGVLIDHEGYESAVLDITERWGDRIDLPDLIARLQSLDDAAQVEAEKLIQKLQRVNHDDY